MFDAVDVTDQTTLCLDAPIESDTVSLDAEIDDVRAAAFVDLEDKEWYTNFSQTTEQDKPRLTFVQPLL